MLFSIYITYVQISLNISFHCAESFGDPQKLNWMSLSEKSTATIFFMALTCVWRSNWMKVTQRQRQCWAKRQTLCYFLIFKKDNKRSLMRPYWFNSNSIQILSEVKLFKIVTLKRFGMWHSLLNIFYLSTLLNVVHI